MRRRIKASTLPPKILERLALIKEGGLKEKKLEEAKAGLQKNMQQLKASFFGDAERQEDGDDEIMATVSEIKQTSFVVALLDNFDLVPFEAQKHFKDVLNFLIQRKGSKMAAYFKMHPVIIDALLIGCGKPELAIIYGDILRTCFKHEALCVVTMNSAHFFELFTFVDNPEFALSSNAFTLLKTCLVSFSSATVPFLEEHHDEFFARFHQCMVETVIKKRQFLKLLVDILEMPEAKDSTRSVYISSPANFQLIVKLLNDEAAKVQFAAFHVFKYFVVNPKKPDMIEAVLVKNAGAFIDFLKGFEVNRDDPKFQEEREFVIKVIEKLGAGEGASTPASEASAVQVKPEPKAEPTAEVKSPDAASATPADAGTPDVSALGGASQLAEDEGDVATDAPNE